MTDQTATRAADDDGEDLSVSLTIRDSDAGGAKEFRTLVLGLTPLVLIEPEVTDDDDVVIKVDSTDLDLEGLIHILGYVVAACEQQLATETANPQE